MLGFIPIPSNQERSKWLIFTFRIFMIILALNVIAEVAITVSFRTSASMDTSRMMILGDGLIILLRFIVDIVLIVFFIMWMRRAYHNLHKGGSRNLRHSEGWAAGAWFIPILSWVWPFQIIRDIWNETQNAFRKNGEYYEKEEDNITGWWWAMWVLSWFVSIIANLIVRSNNLETGYLFSALSTLGYLFAGFLAVMMIKRISAMEDNMMDRAQQYYAWVTQQQSEQFHQQQNQTETHQSFQQHENPVQEVENPVPPQDNYNRQPEDFYKPSGPDSPPSSPPPSN
ncbi:MAG: DUF4328 domain-containing protein [Bacteroidota bacterium]|nr:DUF4328 domain-containing protein [Bacteroidota bacterium]